MTQNQRIVVGVVVLLVVVGLVLGVEALRRNNATVVTDKGVTLAPGSVPIYQGDNFASGFTPQDLEQLPGASFVDAEEGKIQAGWMLRDVILLHIKRDDLQADTIVTVSSSSRGKSVQLTWAEVDNPDNKVMFDLSGRGTLKLVSVLERLDVRDEWVQDVDRIEIASP